jgi:hypothetical protein
MNIRQGIILTLTAASIAIASTSYASNKKLNETDYCINNGGKVEVMPAKFDTHSGYTYGLQKRFCTFQKDGGFIAIGLNAFGSKKPNLAATYIKAMPTISKNSPLWSGEFENPSMNVCKNIGGSNIIYSVKGVGGAFENNIGDNDICVFGDGSMVSAWSLIYMANGRTGYEPVKNLIRSKPLDITLM